MTATLIKAASVLRRRSAKIAIDVALFAGFITEFLTREPSFDPDYLLHSWVGIVLVPVVALHLIGNRGWIARVWAKRRSDREFGLGVLNAVLGACAAICVVTGFPPWLGWTEGGPISTVHTATGLISIVLMFVHLAWNRRRIGSLLRPRAV